ncbi:MAG: WYL domain-containing protein [Bacillota bacterium]|jgi:predicted DNA-binding transcriptional regulator YafY|nr:WYL domain-containing protein [Bacillota bacterium]MDD4708301.1 WYL domain-containing protein [Bacillota bacterium]
MIDVAIRFDPHQARWIRERNWHPSQRLEFLEDGSLILTMTVSSLDEVKRWMLGFGRHAEVLKPKKLRQAVAEEIKAMEYIYN